MSTWQGIAWGFPCWGPDQWSQLKSLLNAGDDFHLLVIQYPLGYDLRLASWYERSKIKRASFHELEGLFSIFLQWEAVFSEQHKKWIWEYPPAANGNPVNARDFNVLQKASEFAPYPYQPSVVKTSHGDLLRVGEDTVVYPEYHYRADPLADVKSKESADGLIYGGVFILPSDYKVKLLEDQIHYLLED